MGISLDTLKTLRERGASVQMQEDLASFLQGGYDSELFLPTIDFIILLQNQVKNQSQEQEQQQSLDLAEFDIPKVYDPNYFAKVSLKATGESIKGAKIAENAKQALLAYLDNMEIQRAKHLGFLGGEGEEIATGRSFQRDPAEISKAKRKDRGTGKIKSMFEALVGNLNALQVNIKNANDAKLKAMQSQKIAQQALKTNSVQAVLQRGAQLKIFQKTKSSSRSGMEKIARASRGFLKDMRRALRSNKNNDDGNNSDSELMRIKIKDVFEKKNSLNPATLDGSAMEAMASKGIDETKKGAKEEKRTETDRTEKTKESTRRNELQSRLRRSSQRQQQQRNAIRQQAAQDADRAQHIDDMTAEKAVKNLQSLGVSLTDSEIIHTRKDLAALAKPQDKQRQ